MTCTEKSTLRPMQTIKTVQVTVSMFRPNRKMSSSMRWEKKERLLTPKVDDAGDVGEGEEDA